MEYLNGKYSFTISVPQELDARCIKCNMAKAFKAIEEGVRQDLEDKLTEYLDKAGVRWNT